jgi:hypothetical protein
MLIAGGMFDETATDPSARYIAKFNGQSWTGMDGGMAGGGPHPESLGVRALAVYDGALIAGGYFTRAGGTQATKIARFDGSDWQAMGEGMSGGDDPAVLALTVFNNELIAAGTFTVAGFNEARYIASWNGDYWDSIGEGLDSPVYALAVHDGQLIAGGENFIKSWNGDSWTDAGFDPQPSGTVRALLEHKGELIVGGQFVGPSGATHHTVLKSVGGHWSPVGTNDIFELEDSEPTAEVRALAIYKGDLIAAGSFNAAGASIARFNGLAWELLGGPSATSSDALAIYSGGLTASGAFPADNGGFAFVGSWYDSDFDFAGDANDDGFVNMNDLMMVITQWGVCPDSASPCTGDVAPHPDGDGIVNINDVLEVIRNWS